MSRSSSPSPTREVLGRSAGSRLSGAPREQWPRKSKLPATYTHADLARIAYEVDTLTPAQLSAVRRATARLVEQGTVLRDVERAAWTQTGREP